MKKIAAAVVNDLNYDQRMQRICSALARHGYEVTLIGRTFPESKPLKERSFKQKRFDYTIQKGKLFYLLHNWKLLLDYLKNDYDIYLANDLDTMMAAWVASKIKRKPLVYDAHEYFPELPEIIERPLVKWIWQAVERLTVPRLKYAYTINHSYQKIFKDKYDKDFEIVRNATVADETFEPTSFKPTPTTSKKFILYQGAVNVGRGLEEMIRAMQYLDYHLVVCGKGDVFDDCVQLAKDLDVAHKVDFRGFVEPTELKHITRQASLGFTFFTNHGESYYYSLANRFFDYFHNGVPQLCVNYPEYKAINDQYEIAVLLDDLETQTIVEAAKKVLENEQFYTKLRTNCLEARKNINWQNEEKKLLALYDSII